MGPSADVALEDNTDVGDESSAMFCSICFHREGIPPGSFTSPVSTLLAVGSTKRCPCFEFELCPLAVLGVAKLAAVGASAARVVTEDFPHGIFL
jgi:hypothetical protein